MDRSIEWIKKVVRLCMREFEVEEEKRECFAGMEREYCQFTEAEKKNIRTIMMTQFEVNDIIYVLSIIVQYMEVEDFQENLLDNILRGEFDCYTGSMLQYQMARYVEGEYKKKRILYKKNMKSFGEMLDINNLYVPVEKRNKKRIVIVTGQLLWETHAPTRKILSIAYALQEHLGYELLFFVCPCNAELPDDLWYNQVLENFNVKFENAPIKIMYKGALFQGYQIGMRAWSCKEYSMMLSMIYSWNPFFVIDMNTTNPMVGLIGTFTTLVSMPMSVECPISEGEILLRVGKKDAEAEKVYSEMLEKHQTQMFLKEKMPVISEASSNNYMRTEFGLPEKKFLLAIVGHRLYFEINMEFVAVMRKILEKEPDVAFVMIGVGEEIGEYFKDEIFNERIYYLGECGDLMGVYKILDLYLNPRRQGGGHSSAMALLAEMPVVTLPECDVALNCGEEFVVQDYEEMIDTVSRYVGDQKFYEEKMKCVRKYKKENGEEKLIRYTKEIVDGVINIMEAGRE